MANLDYRADALIILMCSPPWNIPSPEPVPSPALAGHIWCLAVCILPRSCWCGKSTALLKLQSLKVKQELKEEADASDSFNLLLQKSELASPGSAEMPSSPFLLL